MVELLEYCSFPGGKNIGFCTRQKTLCCYSFPLRSRILQKKYNYPNVCTTFSTFWRDSIRIFMNFSSGSLFTLCFPSFESFPFFYLSATLFCGLTRELWNIDRKKSLIHHLQPLEELIDSEARKNVHWSIWDNPILEIFRMYIPDQNCRGFRHPISNICHTFMENASTLMLMSLCNENGSRESSELYERWSRTLIDPF